MACASRRSRGACGSRSPRSRGCSSRPTRWASCASRCDHRAAPTRSWSGPSRAATTSTRWRSWTSRATTTRPPSGSSVRRPPTTSRRRCAAGTSSASPPGAPRCWPWWMPCTRSTACATRRWSRSWAAAATPQPKAMPPISCVAWRTSCTARAPSCRRPAAWARRPPGTCSWRTPSCGAPWPSSTTWTWRSWASAARSRPGCWPAAATSSRARSCRPCAPPAASATSACASCCGDGAPVRSALDERVIGIELEQLQARAPRHRGGRRARQDDGHPGRPAGWLDQLPHHRPVHRRAPPRG